MISFLKLIRYKNLLMILLTMILTKQVLFYSSFIPDFQFLTLVLSVIFIAIGGNIVNDIFDVDADKINKPNRVFIDKYISKEKAWFLYYVFTFIGITLGFYVTFTKNHFEYNTVFIFSAFALFYYSKYLKKIVIFGNLIISILCALPIIIFLIFDIDSKNLIFIYASFAFLTTLIREIIKDIEDVDGDLKLKAKTLPIVLGRKRAKNIAVVLSVILLISLIQIATNYLYTTPILLGYTFVFILMPLSYFTYQLYNADKKKQFHFLSNFMKVIMFLGILSMILFKFQ